MAILFTCPNGHPLSAGEDKAGRSARCPKCNAIVRIPGLSSPSGKGISSSDPNRAEQTPDGMIVFLCPNGHRLNGPAKLQGKAGQCPHCGAKFRIPFQDPDEEAAFQASQHPSESETESAPADEAPQPSESEGLSEPSLDDYGEETPLEEFPEPEVDLGLENVEPEELPAEEFENEEEYRPPEPGWPTLFPYLWKQKSPGSEVDLYLTDGTKFTPQWFSPSWSLAEQGVFAVRDTEGAYTILSLAWDAIVRVEVRSVIDLPDGMFE
ncbi:MAG TPA: hypothetical protein VFE24_14325 [Pirellulales bacterium]|jgi:hypothetical protein|nr:hypothetical protein [Pirellulales bacterium]